MHHPTDRITHTTAFVTPVVEHWLEREIAQWVHPIVIIATMVVVVVVVIVVIVKVLFVVVVVVVVVVVLLYIKLYATLI